MKFRVDDKRSAAIRARCEAATPGPWACRPTINETDELRDAVISKGAGNLTVADDVADEDSFFIASCRVDVLDLLDDREEMRKELRRWRLVANYADHTLDCRVSDGPCTCGYRAALLRGEE